MEPYGTPKLLAHGLSPWYSKQIQKVFEGTDQAWLKNVACIEPEVGVWHLDMAFWIQRYSFPYTNQAILTLSHNEERASKPHAQIILPVNRQSSILTG